MLIGGFNSLLSYFSCLSIMFTLSLMQIRHSSSQDVLSIVDQDGRFVKGNTFIALVITALHNFYPCLKPFSMIKEHGVLYP